MRGTAVTEGWIEAPLRRFVHEARAMFALLLHPSGQAVGQHGFARAVDVMSASALAAAIHASAGELGRELDGQPFRSLYHAGLSRQIFLGEVNTGRGHYIFLTVFDRESSLGLVQLYFRDFCRDLASASGAEPEPPPSFGTNLEQDLNRSLAVLFGRAEPSAPEPRRPLPPA